ncbi:hypothetical protein P7K49_020225 [Saguinus oedipus]|uniref:Uncharacterized protein n=1 Tax=Saguinus oedipus TaxID=9490 RepID=A0ABQ9UZL8_SAGOE|nr:hypothetical protein P7K49_020225 [Saguinus oedipus]
MGETDVNVAKFLNRYSHGAWGVPSESRGPSVGEGLGQRELREENQAKLSSGAPVQAPESQAGQGGLPALHLAPEARATPGPKPVLLVPTSALFLWHHCEQGQSLGAVRKLGECRESGLYPRSCPGWLESDLTAGVWPLTVATPPTDMVWL